MTTKHSYAFLSDLKWLKTKTWLTLSFLCNLFIAQSCTNTGSPSNENENSVTRTFAVETNTVSTDLNEAIVFEEGESEENFKADEQKKALIIANGYYQKETQWRNINSHADIPIVTDALIKQGFKEENIIVHKDLDHQSMTAVLESYPQKLSAGDVVYIHYSGHGQQIYDNNADEVDGYDEAIIPVDAPGDYKRGGYTGDKHLRDEDLGAYLDAIRSKLGPEGNLLVLLDACHSGTGTRGLNSYRGTMEVFEPEDYQAPVNASKETTFDLMAEDQNLAPAVYFFGASADELNYEYQIEKGKYIGSLSYAFSKAFSEADKNSTYEGLFNEIKLTMATIAPKQTPVAEGVLNQEILGGELRGKLNYYKVLNYSTDGGNYATVNAGVLAGLNQGTVVTFHQADKTPEDAPLSTGVVIYADLLSSEVELNTKISAKDAFSSWVYMKERNYGNLGVNVKIDLKQKELSDELLAELSNVGFVKIDNENPDLILESGSTFSRGDNVQLYTRHDFVFWEEDPNKVTAESVLERIIDYAQKEFIRHLEMEDASLDASFEFIPLKTKKVGNRYLPDGEDDIANKINAAGDIEFKDGDMVNIKVSNTGTKDLYFTLLDIQPDNKINILLPSSNQTAAEMKLKPGKSYTSPAIQFSEPFGTEMFKLITTAAPLNLKEIISSRGPSSGAENKPNNPFEMLMSESFKSKKGDGTRGGGETPSIPSGSVNIYSVTFKIAE
jgi:hypothetical protein